MDENEYLEQLAKQLVDAYTGRLSYQVALYKRKGIERMVEVLRDEFSFQDKKVGK